MISRRLVRIKTLQALYAWQQSGVTDTASGRKMLENSLLAPFDVFLFLLEFPFHFNEYLESEQTIEKSKYYPDKQRIRELGMLSGSVLSDQMHQASLRYKHLYFKSDWKLAAEQFDNLFNELKEQDFVRDHLIFDHPNVNQEKVFMDSLFHYLCNGSESFHSIMEDLYSSWNDDEMVLLRELLKTIESADQAGNLTLPLKPAAADEDIDFGIRLFLKVTETGKEMESDIELVTDNWDPGRIAILDLLSIKMAMAEFIYFPVIPVKVTINEYLDISREYSTPGSSRFLNGILDKLRILLEKDGRIQKSGRGLRDR